ncbi:M20 aminoacylase family protein [Aliiroseovarius subalbicans]|uniref:M20 aminoacylase family protein n=1 Tax=Aliiroseovarius subalbicans TaxID=2925840 RepID=UPI001F5A911C|nr:M20 aminoacylase family protein [Aliiroseovarius subalbicans]MCI2398481.1 M20 family metallopeptidase [Aliiroseovarius subalbicans]
MPIINRIADYAEDMTTWRRWMHMHPELGLECHETAAYVVDRLKEFGVDEIHEQIGVSGVVAIINGQGDGGTIGLRADMDALPMPEETGLDYASTVEGRMHACGHDGHTTMLLGAAKYLAETRRFAGKVALIFQPAEENGGGAKVMCDEGMMDRFGVDQVYGIHNVPDQEFGQFFARTGPLLAAVDTFTVTLKGQGGHGAYPQETRDPVIAAAGLAMALQTVVSRNVHAVDQLVVSVTQIHGGSAENVIADSAWIQGTVRSFKPEVRDMAERRIRAIIEGQAASFDVTAEIEYERGYPATVNHQSGVDMAAKAALDVAGQVDLERDPEMGAEDFAYMLEERPGAYFFLGIGPGAGLHNPKYDFNDDAAPIGASFFARLVETAQPL